MVKSTNVVEPIKSCFLSYRFIFFVKLIADFVKIYLYVNCNVIENTKNILLLNFKLIQMLPLI